MVQGCLNLIRRRHRRFIILVVVSLLVLELVIQHGIYNHRFKGFASSVQMQGNNLKFWMRGMSNNITGDNFRYFSLPINRTKSINVSANIFLYKSPPPIVNSSTESINTINDNFPIYKSPPPINTKDTINIEDSYDFPQYEKSSQPVNNFLYKSPQPNTNSKVLVIGATSDVGLFLVKYFKLFKGYNVFALDFYPLQCETSLENWYQLLKLNVDTKIVLDPEKWNIKDYIYDTIVYAAYHGKRSSSSSNEVKLLESFVKLLELNINRHVDLYFIAPDKTSLTAANTISSAWLNLYEKVLDCYRNMYGLSGVILRVTAPSIGTNGDKECSCFRCKETSLHDIPYFDAVRSKGVFHEVNFNSYCYPVSSCTGTLPRKNVIMSTYFTNVRNPQYNKTFRKNRFRFMQNWFQTAMKYQASILIFHDSMDDAFQESLKALHKDVDLVKVTNLHGRSPNDYRYYLFHEYLVTHPAVGHVIMTDIRDVDFLSNPFQVMDQIGSNHLFMGLDIPTYMSPAEYGVTTGVLRRCHASHMRTHIFSLWPNYNAGVIGGMRGIMISYLRMIMDDLDQTPQTSNCNMASMIYVTKKYFQDDAFFGFPFQCPFKCGIYGPNGCSVRHKYI